MARRLSSIRNGVAAVECPGESRMKAATAGSERPANRLKVYSGAARSSKRRSTSDHFRSAEIHAYSRSFGSFPKLPSGQTRDIEDMKSPLGKIEI